MRQSQWNLNLSYARSETRQNCYRDEILKWENNLQVESKNILRFEIFFIDTTMRRLYVVRYLILLGGKMP